MSCTPVLALTLKFHVFVTPFPLTLVGLPDPPVKVELCDWDVDHMDLQWMFPPSDGGAPILLYKVRTDKKENQIFLIYKEIQNGAVAKSYVTNGLPIFGELFAHFLIY
jgi:hypothetical protein